MAADLAALPAPRSYGNFRRAVSAGVGKLGLIGTAILFVGLFAVMVAIKFAGLLWAAALGLLLAALLAAVSIRNEHHQTVLQRAFLSASYTVASWRGATVYRSGPTSSIPYHRFALPGLAAGIRVSEWEDSDGAPFVLLHHPGDNSWSIVASSEPNGGELADPAQINSYVDAFGGWLASLADEAGCLGASVTIETAPDTGTRLRTEIEANLDPGASPVAHAMYAEIGDTYPSRTAQVTAWTTVTFSGAESGTGRQRDAQAMAADLGLRLPGLFGDLAGTGAGAARAATLTELAEQVCVSYDPAMGPLLDRARAAGEDADLDWSEVGPTGTDAGRFRLLHEGAASVTYGMTLPPRGEVHESVLTRLLAPHPDIDRKRVTLLYEPISPARAPDVADADVTNARTRAAGTKVGQRAASDLGAAVQNAKDEARGAALFNFAVVVTATVTNPDRLPAAQAALDNLLGTARLRCRPLAGQQDSAFLLTLPLGVIPWRHLRIPAELQETM